MRKLLRIGVPMSDEVAARYEDERQRHNLERVTLGLPVAFLLHLLSSLTFFLSTARPGVEQHWRALMLTEHSAMAGVTAAVFAAVLWARSRGSAVARRWLPPGIAMGYLFFGAVDSAIDQRVTTSIASYILVSFVFALLVRLRPVSALIQAAVALGAFAVCHLAARPDEAVLLSNFSSALGASVTSVLLSVAFTVSGQRDFVNGVTIQSQHDELEAAFARMRELAERAEAASRAKSAFLATMSHEIRTPMNGVMGLTELLSTMELTAVQRAVVQTITEAGQNLRRLIDDVLDFSKIEAGQLTIESVAFDASAMVEAVRLLFSATASSRGVLLVSQWPEGAPRWFRGDVVRLRQVLSNLVGNAVKFTERGAVRIEIEVEVEGDITHLSLAVVDHGPGMTPEQQSRLFRAFSQGDDSTTRQYGGTGLGLAISKRLVEAMGGTIGVESVLGQGSTFRVRVALPVAPAPPQKVISIRPDQRAAARLRGRVLVAEDNTINMLVAREMLRRLGLDVLEAKDGRAALEVLEQTAVDVVLTDLNMPQLDGYELARALRGRGDRTPIVALTANVVAEDLTRCVEEGMNDTLTKPFSMAEMERTLRRWLRPECLVVSPAA